MKLQEMWGVWSSALLQPRADPQPCLLWDHSQPLSNQPGTGRDRAEPLNWGGVSINAVGLDLLLLVLLH